MSRKLLTELKITHNELALNCNLRDTQRQNQNTVQKDLKIILQQKMSTTLNKNSNQARTLYKTYVREQRETNKNLSI